MTTLRARLLRLIPSREQLQAGRFTRWLAPWLGQRALWHLSRRGVALGMAIGIFFGLLIPIAQIPASAAVAIVLRANKTSSELGGHIASFQSSALLYDTGFQHFWHAPSDTHGGDLIFIQGHVSPGIYARSFVEGRITEDQQLDFRE